MKTIFDYNPTSNELESIRIVYENISLADYLKDLDARAKHSKTPKEYEALVDIQELASIRGDRDLENETTHQIETEFGDVDGKIFNE